MEEKKKINTGLLEKIIAASEKARRKLIEEEKRNNGYLIIANKDGKPIKVLAKDL